MRLLFFNRSFHPDVEATGQLLAELCDDLSNEHDITVVAGRPYNMGRFGSWLPVKREMRGSVQILRAFNPRLNKSSFVGRVINLLSYFCFSFVAGFFARRPDVIIVETDPPVLGLVALFFAKLYRAKLVFYLQDLYPDVGIALGKLKNPLLVRGLEAGTRMTLLGADRIVVLGEDMRRRVIEKGYPVADRIAVVPNWVDTSRTRPQTGTNAFRLAHRLNGHFIVMFSGNLGLSQELHRVIEVARSLQNEPHIRFMFVGEGAAKASLMKMAAAQELKNVFFLPYQPKEELATSLSAANVHLIPLQRGLAGLIVPSKLYGIMSVGRAFIAPIEEQSEVGAAVRLHACGIRVDPDSTDQLREVILWASRHPTALQEMGQRGRAAAVQHFDRKISVDKFRAVLRGVAVEANADSRQRVSRGFAVAARPGVE